MEDLQPGRRGDQQGGVGDRVQPGPVPRVMAGPACHAPVEDVGHTRRDQP